MYGHETSRCDPAGCAGFECYLGQMAEGERGDTMAWDGDVLARTDADDAGGWARRRLRTTGSTHRSGRRGTETTMTNETLTTLGLTTIRDLTARVREDLGLGDVPQGRLHEEIEGHRESRYEEIDADELHRIERGVWAGLGLGEWPFGDDRPAAPFRQPRNRRVAMTAPVHRSPGLRVWRLADEAHLTASARGWARVRWALHLRRCGRTDGLRLDVGREQARALLRWAGGGREER